MKRMLAIVLILACVITMAGCGKDDVYRPITHIIGTVWESEAGSLKLIGYSLENSYTTNDGSVIEAEDGQMLMVIEFETQLNEDWFILGKSPFGRSNDGVPTHYPICAPIVWDGNKTVLLYSLPEIEATYADFSDYTLHLTLVGGGSADATFKLMVISK